MRVAVIFRGHKRNWDYVKLEVLNFFENLRLSCDSLDYFVAVWRKNSEYEDIKLDFPLDKLKGFLIVNDNIKYNAMTGPAYLSKLLYPFLSKEELRTKSYDVIIETRFDMWFKKRDILFKLPPKNSVGYTSVFPEISMHMDDHCFVFDRLSYEQWHEALGNFEPSEDMHLFYGRIARACGFQTYIIPWWSSGIERPVQDFDKLLINDRKKVILDMNLDPDDFLKHLEN